MAVVEPLAYWKWYRIGDSLMKSERIATSLRPAEWRSSSEDERASLFEGGAGAKHSIRLNGHWERGKWGDETSPQFASRIRKETAKFIAAVQYKGTNRHRKGPLVFIGDQNTQMGYLAEAITGTGLETITTDSALDYAPGMLLFILHTNLRTHAVIELTDVGPSPTEFQCTDVGIAFPLGSRIAVVEYYYPNVFPISGPSWERDDVSPDGVVTTEFSFEGSEDAIDTITVVGPDEP